MKTNTIAWHEKCLANMRHGLSERHEKMKNAEQEFYRLRFDVEILEGQLRRARLEGREVFDADKFNKSRTPKAL